MKQRKIPVAVLGATGMAGQRYIQLLENHPMFEITELAASQQSKGKSYSEAVEGRWLSAQKIPREVAQLTLCDSKEISSNIRLIFSAVDSAYAKELEPFYAKRGQVVVSNASAFRNDPLVPVIVPEVNLEHLKLLDAQKIQKAWDGALVTKPNCSIQSYLIPIHALQLAGYEVSQIFVTTLQALSGAGYPGLSALSLTENVVPYIAGEEEKSEKEPLRILGKLNSEQNRILNSDDLKISAHCNRVPVLDGHLACVSLKFKSRIPTIPEVQKILSEFKSHFILPSSPNQLIHVYEECDRPQSRLDRDKDKGMAIHVGRIRSCPLLDLRFVGLSHNTLRGAAGGGVLIAEAMFENGYLN